MATAPVKPLLYRPAPQWQLWAAVGGAVAIHLTAVALAQRHEAPPAEIKPEFVEERTPPPRPPPSAQQKFTPIKAQAMTMSRAKALAVNAPRPQYPYEARSRKIMGSGVIVMHVDPASGNVTDATVSKSIGSPILDNAAVSAFRQWRFRPGTASTVTAPITFTLTGASY